MSDRFIYNSTASVSLSPSEYDAIMNFFIKKGYSKELASSATVILVSAARYSNVEPMKVVSRLNTMNDTQLREFLLLSIGQINSQISTVGKIERNNRISYDSRNIKF